MPDLREAARDGDTASARKLLRAVRETESNRIYSPRDPTRSTGQHTASSRSSEPMDRTVRAVCSHPRSCVSKPTRALGRV